MLTLESNPISELSSNQMVLSASYTKFNNSQPIVHRFYEWVTGNSYLGSYYNYWTWSYLYKDFNTRTISIKFWTSKFIYMTGVKLHILLV